MGRELPEEVKTASSRRVATALAVVLLAGTALPVLADAPTNDDFTDRESIDVSNLPTTVTASNAGASTESGEPEPCTNGELTKTVWYTFTPGADQRVEIETFDSDFDTIAALYTGSSLEDLEPLACSDDIELESEQAGFRVSVQEGTPYHIQVGGDDGDAGSIDLTISTAPSTVTREYVGNAGGVATTCDEFLVGANVGGGMCPVDAGGVSTVDFDIDDGLATEGSILVAFEFFDVGGDYMGVTFTCGDTYDLAVPDPTAGIQIFAGGWTSWALDHGIGPRGPPPCTGIPTSGSMALTLTP